jgi:hypothetical protein
MGEKLPKTDGARLPQASKVSQGETLSRIRIVCCAEALPSRARQLPGRSICPRRKYRDVSRAVKRPTRLGGSGYNSPRVEGTFGRFASDFRSLREPRPIVRAQALTALSRAAAQRRSRQTRHSATRTVLTLRSPVRHRSRSRPFRQTVCSGYRKYTRT